MAPLHSVQTAVCLTLGTSWLQVYLAQWHQTAVAVKVLVDPGEPL